MGWLTLPGALVCAERSTGSGCKKGDTSFELHAWELFRTNPRFAFGAGFLLGLIPTTDAPRSDPMGIVRNHSRSLPDTRRHHPPLPVHQRGPSEPSANARGTPLFA